MSSSDCGLSLTLSRLVTCRALRQHVELIGVGQVSIGERSGDFELDDPMFVRNQDQTVVASHSAEGDPASCHRGLGEAAGLSKSVPRGWGHDGERDIRTRAAGGLAAQELLDACRARR